MKKVLIYATCQGRMLSDFFWSSAEFNDQYTILNTVQNYDLIRGQKTFLEKDNGQEFLEQADVFIYQPLDRSYGPNATDFLCEFLRPQAKTFTIPYVYNYSFWPVTIAMMTQPTDEFHLKTVGEIKNVDSIRNLLESGMTTQEILDAYEKDQIDFQYQTRFEYCQDLLRKKELGTSIKVSDFIQQNYQKTKLFTAPMHPTYDVIFHMGNQILKELGLGEISVPNDCTQMYLGGDHVTILPYDHTARRALNLSVSVDDNSVAFYKKIIAEYAKLYFENKV